MSRVSPSHFRSSAPRGCWSSLGRRAGCLRDILRLSEIDPPNIQLETLRSYVSQLGLSDQDVLPYLANVLGLGQIDPEIETRLQLLDASMLQRQAHAALRQFLLAEASY